MTPADAQSLLDAHFAPWVRDLNLTIIEIEASHVLIRMPLGEHLRRVGGIASGQALAALADTSMVLAAVGHAGSFKPFATTDLHTQFLRPASGAAVLCDARVVRAGKSLVFARADMREEDNGKIVSTATATFYAP